MSEILGTLALIALAIVFFTHAPVWLSAGLGILIVLNLLS